MDGLSEQLTPLTKFAIAIGASVLLPKAMERLRLPGVLGFIIAGILIGPNALKLIAADGPVISLLAELGKLLFMFFVGFGIDLDEFKKSRSRSFTFGALTFFLPFAGGVFLGRATGTDWNSAQLAGTVFNWLFIPTTSFKPVENFRDEARALLAKTEANKLIKLCQTESAPRVSFETAERNAVAA